MATVNKDFKVKNGLIVALGGSFGGAVVVGTPTENLHAATKEYVDQFPCAYRQWRADSHCNLIHGYSFSIKLYSHSSNKPTKKTVI